MRLPTINLRRVYLIARRDFLGYIKTWGFWISFFLPFVFGGFVYFASQLNISVEPVRYETILDDTGEHKDKILERHQALLSSSLWKEVTRASRVILSEREFAELETVYETKGFDAASEILNKRIPGFTSRFKVDEQLLVFVDVPVNTIGEMKSYLDSGKTIEHEGAKVGLNGVLHINDDTEPLSVEYWSSNVNSYAVQVLAKGYFENLAQQKYLKTGDLSLQGLRAASNARPAIKSFDPTKATSDETGQLVTIQDRVPFYLAAGLAAILWLTVFSGSYMLLTSMLEEKLNKLLEMMLASTRFSEIIFGKLIGVALITVTAMLPYLIIGLSGLVLIALKSPEAAAGLSNALTPKLLIFFPIFLVLGYIFYGALFIALGALAESMQDAQTLTTPVMIVLTSCIMVVPLSLNSPDSPILTFASWFPISAPFANIVRLPNDPSWWELTFSALFVFLLSLGVIWMAGRVFRYGVLSGAGVKGVRQWIGRVIFRRKPAR